jgi:peptide subunit release factor 1 (eRF1)
LRQLCAFARNKAGIVHAKTQRKNAKDKEENPIAPLRQLCAFARNKAGIVHAKTQRKNAKDKKKKSYCAFAPTLRLCVK